MLRCLFLLLTVVVMATQHFGEINISDKILHLFLILPNCLWPLNNHQSPPGTNQTCNFLPITKQLGLSLVVSISLYALSAKITSLHWGYILFVLLFPIFWFLENLFAIICCKLFLLFASCCLHSLLEQSCADFVCFQACPVRKMIIEQYKQFFQINHDFYILQIMFWTKAKLFWEAMFFLVIFTYLR